jgi:hypothetical protein
MLTERSKVPSEQKKRYFFPAKNPVDARREVVARARNERIFSTAVRPKIGKKGVLDEYFNSGPPSCAMVGCATRGLEGKDIHLKDIVNV